MSKDVKEDILSGHKEIVLDTSVIINYLSTPNADSTKWLDKHVFTEASQVRLHSHKVNQTELFYLICREKGTKKAKKVIKSIEEFINFHDKSELSEVAGTIKCKLSSALADCFSIATGIWLKSPILFKKEKELSESIIKSLKKDFDAKMIIFKS
ncbi:MAG: PIN domain-containing protein [Promethearchaeota archaeon]